MEDKKAINIRLSTAILCFVIAILIIVIAFMYFYFTNQIKFQQSNVTNNLPYNSISTQSNEINNTVTQTAITENLDINSSLVKKIYEYVPALDNDKIQPSAYQDSKITKENLNDEYLLAYAFKNLVIPESEKESIKEGNSVLTPDTGWYSFSASLLQKKVVEMYGSNIPDRDFGIYSGEGCTYKNNGRYTHGVGGASIENMVNLRTIKKAYQIADTIYIEDNYMSLQENDDKEESKLYETSNSDKLISSIKWGRLRNKNSLEEYKAELEKIKSEYSDKMTSYKHTFKKNADGSYYWYSTEPVK